MSRTAVRGRMRFGGGRVGNLELHCNCVLAGRPERSSRRARRLRKCPLARGSAGRAQRCERRQRPPRFVVRILPRTGTLGQCIRMTLWFESRLAPLDGAGRVGHRTRQ
jgi:hypothetical protein